VLHLWWHLW